MPFHYIQSFKIFVFVLQLSFFNIPLSVQDGNIYGNQLLTFYYFVSTLPFHYIQSFKTFVFVLQSSFFNIPLNVQDSNIYGSQLLTFYYLINN